jgi:hypothetical protein
MISLVLSYMDVWMVDVMVRFPRRWGWSHVAMSYKRQLVTHMIRWVVFYVKV